VTKTKGAPRGPGKPFQRGNRFGKGRPIDSRNRATLAKSLLDGDGEAITHKAIDLAKAGNEAALRLCLERLIAPRKERPVRLKLRVVPKDDTVGSDVMMVVARDGIAQHYTALTIPLTDIFLDPALGLKIKP
jgi:hypothetical protein